MASWIPVATNFIESGELTSLAADESWAKRITSREGLSVLGSALENFQVYQDYFSASVASSIGFGDVFQASSSADAISVIYEAMLYNEAVADPPSQDGVYGVRYGVGVRLVAGMWDIKAKLKVDLYSVALATEAKLANSWFRIETPGVTDSAVISKFPNRTNLNLTTLQEFRDALDEFVKYVLANKDSLAPAGFQVYLGSAAAGVVDEAHSTVYAMRRIVNGDTLSDALNHLPNSVDGTIVRFIYQVIVDPIGEHQRPSDGQKDRARKWLKG